MPSTWPIRFGHVGTEESLRYEPFFDAVGRINIVQLLLFVDLRTDFLSAFDPVMERYQREKADKPVTITALMVYATNIGLGRMAEISNMTRQQLSSTVANFIRLLQLDASKS